MHLAEQAHDRKEASLVQLEIQVSSSRTERHQSTGAERFLDRSHVYQKHNSCRGLLDWVVGATSHKVDGSLESSNK